MSGSWWDWMWIISAHWNWANQWSIHFFGFPSSTETPTFSWINKHFTVQLPRKWTHQCYIPLGVVDRMCLHLSCSSAFAKLSEFMTHQVYIKLKMFLVCIPLCVFLRHKCFIVREKGCIDWHAHSMYWLAAARYYVKRKECLQDIWFNLTVMLLWKVLGKLRSNRYSSLIQNKQKTLTCYQWM